jgi:hypothetical protein
MAISTVVLQTNDVLLIETEDNVLALSIQAPTGSTVEVRGSSPFVASLNGTRQQVGLDTMTLASGEGMTVVAYNVTNLIDNLTIKPTTGTCNVLIQT